LARTTRKRRKTRKPKKEDWRLTPRQLQCLVLVGKGKSDRQIGRTLRISEETVHKHVEAAKKRVGARSRIQLVIRALVARKLTLRQIIK
jgi:DNA-binding NarL/FixJ family response regulator